MLLNETLCEALDEGAGRGTVGREGKTILSNHEPLPPSERKGSNIISALMGGGLTLRDGTKLRAQHQSLLLRDWEFRCSGGYTSLEKRDLVMLALSLSFLQSTHRPVFQQPALWLQETCLFICQPCRFLAFSWFTDRNL